MQWTRTRKGCYKVLTELAADQPAKEHGTNMHIQDDTFTFKSAALEQLPDVQDGIDQLICAFPQGIKLL